MDALPPPMWGVYVAMPPEAVRAELLRRAALYDELIEKQMEVDGLVATTRRERHYDLCDSLLFSAMRHLSVAALMPERAVRTWSPIRSAFLAGRWRRHPRCLHVPTSRDMLLGIIYAQSMLAHADRDHEILQRTRSWIEQSGGFLDAGPVYVSFVSPGIGRLIRLLTGEGGQMRWVGPITGIEGSAPLVRWGFRTLPLDGLFLSRGYVSHLQALTVFSELALARGGYVSRAGPSPPASEAWGAPDKVLSRAAHELHGLDPANLFFRAAALEVEGHLSGEAVLRMARILVASTYFPSDRLPTGCDRGVDYLWQRDSAAWPPRIGPERCSSVTFSGVDFLTLAALLHLRWPTE